MSENDWQLWRSFIAMSQQLSRELDRQLQRDAGISQADFGVLSMLTDAPERRLRTGELAEFLGWEKSRVSHQVTRMEARGLVERSECDTDARGTWIGITADGRRTLLSATREHMGAIRSLFLDQLDDGDRRSLETVSERVLDTISPPACDIADEKGMLADRGERPSRVPAA